jgi:hypothetical protein
MPQFPDPFFEVLDSMLKFRRLLAGVLVVTGALVASMAQAAESNKYLPNSAEGVVVINVKQLLEAPLVKNNLDTLKAMLTSAGDAQKILDEIGFDPFQDVETVTIAIDESPNKPLILVQGKFDMAKIQTKAESAAKENSDVLTIGKAGGHTIYEVKAPEQNETMYVGLVDGTTVAASPNKDYVVEVLDKKDGKKKAEMKKELKALLAKADSKQTISIVSLGGPLAATGQPTAAKVASIVGGINISDEVKVELVLNTKNADDAKSLEGELKDGIDQVKALVDLTANQNKDLKPLVEAVDTLKVSSQGTAVTIKGELTKEVIKKLMAKGQ